MGAASAVLGGLTSGVTDVAGFSVDTVMKVANFVGLKNIVAIGVTAAGAMGHNEALTFAGAGALLGGKSTLATLALSGAGFMAGSMMQASEEAAEISETAPPTVESAITVTNRYEATDISEIMPNGGGSLETGIELG